MKSADKIDWNKKYKERQKNLRRVQSFGARSLNLQPYLYFVGGLILLSFAGILAGYFGYFGNAQTTDFSKPKTIIVRNGGDFQAALNGARSGDTIYLQAGATFTGNFTLPKKKGDEFITVRSSADDSQLPSESTRIDPKKYLAQLPKLISPNNDPTLLATDGAHHFRFIGIEFLGTKDGVGNIIKIGTTDEAKIEDLPHHIEFDRVVLRSVSPAGQRRGIAANGRFLKIYNSHISDIKRDGDESQAIAIWATDGKIEIVNNYLEAAAINILFGGAGSRLNLIPTDCLVKDNWLNKPVKWRTEQWAVKNLFEIKNGRRIRVENNLMTNNWGHAQDGTAVLFTTRADTGPASTIEDVEFVNNIVRGSGNGISVYGPEGAGGHRLTIRNNIFDDISGSKWNGTGFFMKSTAWDTLIIENNTIIQTANISSAYGDPVTGFVFRNNIVFENEYGFKGDSTASGNQTINTYFPKADISFNAVIGGEASRYNRNNFYPSSIKKIGFVNFEAGDFSLREDSPLSGKGFQGMPIGAFKAVKNYGEN